MVLALLKKGNRHWSGDLDGFHGCKTRREATTRHNVGLGEDDIVFLTEIVTDSPAIWQ
jgi:hypothetical protein